MVVMDIKKTTDDYISKYIQFLNKLHTDTNALAPLKVSILQNHISQLNENESTNIKNHCQYCLTSWNYGNFVLKTHPKHKSKNCKSQKKQFLFTMVVKCLVCFNVTKSEFKKNKILDYKPVEIMSEKAIVMEKTSETPEILKEKPETKDKKPKKKKRNLYAGLNPLVFKNLHKTKLNQSRIS